MSEPSPPGDIRYWKNGWGYVAAMLRVTAEPCQGIRVWFEGPRHGWIFVHVEMVGMGEFICRASYVPNDFVSDLIAALQQVLDGEPAAAAAAHGEPDTFEFRFSQVGSAAQIVVELAAFPGFDDRTPERGEPVMRLGGDDDGMCRAFCFGLCELESSMSADDYAAAMEYPFPTQALARLKQRLGGEFASK